MVKVAHSCRGAQRRAVIDRPYIQFGPEGLVNDGGNACIVFNILSDPLQVFSFDRQDRIGRHSLDRINLNFPGTDEPDPGSPLPQLARLGVVHGPMDEHRLDHDVLDHGDPADQRFDSQLDSGPIELVQHRIYPRVELHNPAVEPADGVPNTRLVKKRSVRQYHGSSSGPEAVAGVDDGIDKFAEPGEECRFSVPGDRQRIKFVRSKHRGSPFERRTHFGHSRKRSQAPRRYWGHVLATFTIHAIERTAFRAVRKRIDSQRTPKSTGVERSEHTIVWLALWKHLQS